MEDDDEEEEKTVSTTTNGEKIFAQRAIYNQQQRKKSHENQAKHSLIYAFHISLQANEQVNVISMRAYTSS